MAGGENPVVVRANLTSNVERSTTIATSARRGRSADHEQTRGKSQTLTTCLSSAALIVAGPYVVFTAK